MKVDIKLNERIAEVEFLKHEGEYFFIRVDNKVYEVDAKQLKAGVFSILHNNQSFLIDVTQGSSNKNFEVSAWNNRYNVDIIDAEAKYQMSRGKGGLGEDENIISSPMPGKIVKVMVKPGDILKAGDTVIIVSAMKMESEYKVKQDCVVSEVLVNEGDTVDSHQAMVIVE
jgi:biotin carboxyl carrier protein